MSLLQEKMGTIIETLFVIKTKEELAILLEISVHDFNKIFIGGRVEKNYHSYEIRKKNGGKRVINSPNDKLLNVQRRLAQILNHIYYSKYTNTIAHGYFDKRSIITNAKQHVSKKHLLNIDLEDFFFSIHFSRVRNLLVSLGIDDTVSKYISILCCLDNKLPQGSPTSPILSNMICKRLDSKLYEYSYKNNVTITRYVDDITISTNSDEAILSVINEKKLDFNLVKIIESNGFKINEKKMWLASGKNRKEVTGIIVNEKLNVPKKFLKVLRSQIKNINNHKDEEKEKEISKLIGKISHLGNVKGRGDSVYIRYAAKLNDVTGRSIFNVDTTLLNLEDYIKNRTASIKCEVLVHNIDEKVINGGNGTGFYAEMNGNYFLITCFHVLKNTFENCLNFSVVNYNHETIVYKFADYEPYLGKNSKVENNDIFIILLSIKPKYFFTIKDEYVFDMTKQITLTGLTEFRDKKEFQNIMVLTSNVESNMTRTVENVGYEMEIYSVAQVIRHGASGGAVLDSQWKVVGIVSNGSSRDNKLTTTTNGFIPIRALWDNGYM